MPNNLPSGEELKALVEKILPCISRTDGSHDWACTYCDMRKELLAALAPLLERKIEEARLEELQAIHLLMYAHGIDKCSDYLEGTEPLCQRLAALKGE